MSLATEEKLAAPPGRFRLIAVDIFPTPAEDWVIGDFDSLDDARKAAEEKRRQSLSIGSLRFYIYDDKGMPVSLGRT